MNTLNHRRCLCLGLVLLGGYLLADSAYMQIKAKAAQMLIHHSWYQRAAGEQPAVPWPWADTKAIALLSIPALEIQQFVMQDASGESLAFGPGLVTGNELPASGGHSMVAGHRDSHFQFLKKLQPGMRLRVSNYRGESRGYQVIEARVLDTDKEALQHFPDQDLLTLISCYPFDALAPGGPLRWIVNAVPI